jgi:hypothetical protein
VFERKNTRVTERQEMAESSNFTAPSVPKFDGDYDHWSLIMENLLRSKEYWSVIESGKRNQRRMKR